MTYSEVPRSTPDPHLAGCINDQFYKRSVLDVLGLFRKSACNSVPYDYDKSLCLSTTPPLICHECFYCKYYSEIDFE